MARPSTKIDLVEAAQTNYSKLMDMVNGLTTEQQEGFFPFEDRDKNIRDVLIHVYEWHNMLKRWYKDGMNGEKPQMPAPGYTWKTTAALNAEIWEKYQDTDLATAKKLVEQTHQEIMELIESHTNEELFSKKVYPWTNTTTLGAYFISSTSSHYDWAMKKIRKYIRSLK